MSQSKKQNFLQGAALLAIATAVVKVIGALYKIPLKMVIGDQGFGYFSTAYQIYSVLLMISTAGFPIAMSRIISQASSLGRFNQVRKVYKTARGIFLGIGIISTLLMVVTGKNTPQTVFEACAACVADKHNGAEISRAVGKSGKPCACVSAAYRKVCNAFGLSALNKAYAEHCGKVNTEC